MIYRDRAGTREVCLIATNGKKHWQLPKGFIERGESMTEAALREVQEETGLRGELVGPLDDIEYWYVSPWEGDPVRVHKFVSFFLFRYTGGFTRDHDNEVDEARWFPLLEAEKTLSFEGERGVIKSAVAKLGSLDRTDGSGRRLTRPVRPRRPASS